MIPSTPALPLLEREAELRVLEDVVAAAASGAGHHVVIEGEAGIGKSALVHAALGRATGKGMTTLQTRASELERQYPYGLVLGLFGPIVREAGGAGSSLFAGAASAVEALFAPDSTAPDASADPFATIHGLYWLTVNAFERQPVCLGIDDAQWADDASLRFLHYLAQRVGDIPIALITAYRTGETGAEDVAAEALRNTRHAVRLQPSSLSENAVGELLVALDPAADASAVRVTFEATQGNPFFVVEVGRDRRNRGTAAVTPVPDSVARFVETRIARLDPSAQRIAEAIAILGEEADLRRAARLADRSEDEALPIVRDLTRLGMLNPSGALGFVHTLVRAAVYGSIPDVARGRMHRDAALLLSDDGAPLGVVAGQLLEADCTHDAHVVDMLSAAATEAVGRGQPGVAARLLERALEEPPTAAQHGEVLLALARAEAQAGSPAAIEHFRAVIDATADQRRRTELGLELGLALITAAAWSDAASVLEDGMRELDASTAAPSEDDQALRARLEASFASAAWFSMERHAEAEAIVDRIVREEELGTVHRGLAVWSAWQRATTVSASAQEMGGLVKRAIAEVPVEELVAEGQTVEIAAGVLVATDDLQLEIELLTKAIRAADRAGLVGKVGIYSYCRAWPFLFTGRLTDAIADAQASLRVAELGAEIFLPATRSVLARAFLERGEMEAAATALELDPERWAMRIDYEVMIPVARAELALAHADAETALASAESAERYSSPMNFRYPVLADYRPSKAIALAQLGRRAEAQAVAAEVVMIARDWGARWTLGSALRVAGIAEGGPAGIELLRESAALLETSPAQLERARTLSTLGSALRRLGRLSEARDVLRTAMDVAHRLGATLLLERSREELIAAGSRPRRYAHSGVEALTPAELRVARLAAEGRTNREIAQALFVTPKAVEFHLGNSYSKLGITSRRLLPRALEIQNSASV